MNPDRVPGCQSTNLAPCEDDESTASINGARSQHVGGVQIVLGDGSARFVNENVNSQVWRSLFSIHGSGDDQETLVGEY